MCAKRILLPLPQPLICCLPTHTGIQALCYNPLVQQHTHWHKPCDTSALFAHKRHAENSALLPFIAHQQCDYTLLVPDFLTIEIAIDGADDTPKNNSLLRRALPIAHPLYEPLQDAHKNHYLVMDASSIEPTSCAQLVAVFPFSQARQLWVQQCMHIGNDQVVVFIDSWQGQHMMSCFFAHVHCKQSLANVKDAHATLDTLCEQQENGTAINECILCEDAAHFMQEQNTQQITNHRQMRSLVATDIQPILDGSLPKAETYQLPPTLLGGLLASMQAPNRWLYTCQYHHLLTRF